MKTTPQDLALQKTTLKLQVIQAIVHQSQEHDELAQRHYSVALAITCFSVFFSFSILGATVSGKLSDQAINNLAGALPLAACIQLVGSAGKQTQANSRQLNQLLDNL